MYKQSPSRSHRSKGLKAKHILQICLLLAVCFWLIYQVKHSHDKSKEFNTQDGKIVGKLQTDGEIQRFGRKDLPRITEITSEEEKRGEDEEEEKEAEEEDEPERKDNVIGNRDDEIDENEPGKTETEPEILDEELVVDEDKEREENEGGIEGNHTGNEDRSESEENEDAGKEDGTEPEENEDVEKEDRDARDITSDDHDHDHDQDHDHDGGSTNTHEAREEQYRADDASSEVAHNIQTIIPETENASLGHENEIWGNVNNGTVAHNFQTIIPETENASLGHENEIWGNVNNGTSSNVTVNEQEKYGIFNLTKSEDNSLQNSTLSHNAKEGETQTEHTNKTEIAAGDKNPSEVSGEFLSSGNGTSASFHDTNDTISHKGEKSENSGLDESSESQILDEGKDDSKIDPIDDSDATFSQEEKESSRTDLDTLPEIKTEVQNIEETTMTE